MEGTRQFIKGWESVISFYYISRIHLLSVPFRPNQVYPESAKPGYEACDACEPPGKLDQVQVPLEQGVPHPNVEVVGRKPPGKSRDRCARSTITKRCSRQEEGQS